MEKTVIIAEAGVNHNGDLNIAKQLIDAAADAGADYVKFQTFIAEELVTKNAKKAEYQKQIVQDGEDYQFKMLKKLELTQEQHFELIDYCKDKGVKFLSTAFDIKSLDFISNLSLDFYKIPSGEITNKPYLQRIAQLGLPIVMSTGMANLDEVKEALQVLIDGGIKKKDVTILHCNTEYPTPYTDVNLNAMLTIKEELGVEIGYSDHTLGVTVPVSAVTMGAKVIEKHFTLNKNMKGPDHKASLNPEELKEMVDHIRIVEQILGSKEKVPSSSEIKNMPIARKSIHLNKDLRKDYLIKAEDLVMKRPGDGISPMRMYDIIGKRLAEDFVQDHKLSLENLV